MAAGRSGTLRLTISCESPAWTSSSSLPLFLTLSSSFYSFIPQLSNTCSVPGTSGRSTGQSASLVDFPFQLGRQTLNSSAREICVRVSDVAKARRTMRQGGEWEGLGVGKVLHSSQGDQGRPP